MHTGVSSNTLDPFVWNWLVAHKKLLHHFMLLRLKKIHCLRNVFLSFIYTYSLLNSPSDCLTADQRQQSIRSVLLDAGGWKRCMIISWTTLSQRTPKGSAIWFTNILCSWSPPPFFQKLQVENATLSLEGGSWYGVMVFKETKCISSSNMEFLLCMTKNPLSNFCPWLWRNILLDFF